MTAILFAGPSLAGAQRTLPETLALRPPAMQGDVFRAAEMRPRAIGLIDGYFEGVPSVWHKEILWALSQGIAVFGSASMGALRAAELHPFGMIGIGRIFADYRDGRIEADDEVALLHGPQETNFVGLTEPLVNVRATCRAAELAGVLEAGEAETVLSAARALFYKARTWRRILDLAGESGLSPEKGRRLSAWLPDGRVDQKRRDALDMVAALQAFLAEGRNPAVTFHFEATFLWERAVAGWSRASAVTDAAVQASRKLRPVETLAGAIVDED